MTVIVRKHEGDSPKVAPDHLWDAISDVVDLTLDMLQREDLEPFQDMVSIARRAVQLWHKANEDIVYKDSGEDEGKMKRRLSTFLALLRKDFILVELRELYAEGNKSLQYGEFVQKDWLSEADTPGLSGWRPGNAGTIYLNYLVSHLVVLPFVQLPSWSSTN
jgi:hypothetical protein